MLMILLFISYKNLNKENASNAMIHIICSLKYQNVNKHKTYIKVMSIDNE